MSDMTGSRRLDFATIPEHVRSEVQRAIQCGTEVPIARLA